MPCLSSTSSRSSAFSSSPPSKVTFSHDRLCWAP
jgi:hypothetical protein